MAHVRQYEVALEKNAANYTPLTPKANRPRQPIPGIEVIAVERVEEAFARVR